MLAEWHEQILAQPPIQKGTTVIDIRDFEVSKLIAQGQRLFGGGDGAVFGVGIDEHPDAVIGTHIVSNVTIGQQHLLTLRIFKIKPLI